ncbi:MAG: ribosomal protein S18-alanine N-acetyltransferase [Azoarcus sp.]|nr:ribosomal protein S18-alanine N-acetyltransferase [Azoarcus sp.]
MDERDLDWVAAQEASLHAFPWTRRNFTDSLACGHLCRLMFDGAFPVAYAVMLMALDEAHLLNFNVAIAEQGRGLGRCLLESLFDEARCNGGLQLFLEVRSSNAPALALYRRSGFIEIGRRAAYYPAREGREDAIVMRRGL